jgi:Ca-activated chloride channel homolog
MLEFGATALALARAPTQTGTLDELVAANLQLWPLLVVVPLVAFAFAWAARQRRRALHALGNPALITRLVASVHHGNRLLVAIVMTVAVACVVGALMRPQYGGTAKIVPASGLDIVLAVDYSKSMLAQDVYPSRSERLEAELSRFLDDADRRGDRVGVVVFAGNARGFPVTRDLRMLKLYLEKADPRSENPGGTAIGKALQLALTFLVDARRSSDETLAEDGSSEDIEALLESPRPDHDQAIILLTDGEDNASEPRQVAEHARRLGVRIYTVGIGSKSGEPIQKFDEDGEPAGFVTDETGNYLMTRIDEDLLQSLADETGGRYVRVDPKAFGLDEVRGMLEDLSRSQREDKIEINREEGYAFVVIPALVLLSIGLGLGERRRVASGREARGGRE